MTATLRVGRCLEPRLPFAPLADVIERRLVDVQTEKGYWCGSSCKAEARLLDSNPRQIIRWRQYGVTWAQADVLAVRLGLHPAEVWPDWWGHCEAD